MASISIVITDNKNGVISSSFNFTDKEIERISETLRTVYNGKVKESPLDDIVVNRQLFKFLSQNLVQHILNTVYNTEVDNIVEKARQSVSKLEVREM